MKLPIARISSDMCNQIIAEICQHTVAPSHGHMDLPVDNPFYQESISQTEMLKTAGYDEHTVEYRHYQSGKHFDTKYEREIAGIVDCKPLMCWVSEIRPGKCTPWHWDINPWEQEHEQLGKLVRYFCFLSEPAPGHIFVTRDDAYYNEPQGIIYQYSHIHDWHAGTNVGIIPKFLLTLTGYQ